MRELLTKGLKIIGRLEEEGFEAFFAGGVVRDLLCGLPPADVDLATNASLPDLASLFPKGKLLGSKGIQAFHLSMEGGGCQLTSYGGGKLKDDLAGRDFTVNALAMDKGGNVTGSSRAMADVVARRLRFNGIPSERLGEDPLRALRLARFAAVLPGFSLDPESAPSCREFGPSLDGCAPERKGREIRLGLAGNPRLFLETIKECGLLEVILPGLFAREYDFLRLCRVLEGLAGEGASLEVRVAALFAPHHRRSSPSGGDEVERAEASLKDWKWPGRSIAEGVDLVKYKGLPLEKPDPDGMAALLQTRGTDFMDSLFLLARHYCTADGHFRQWSENRKLYVSMAVRSLEEGVLPPGEEVMEKFNLSPGPALGEILDEVKLRRLYPGMSRKEEIWAYIEKFMKGRQSPED